MATMTQDDGAAPQDSEREDLFRDDDDSLDQLGDSSHYESESHDHRHENLKEFILRTTPYALVSMLLIAAILIHYFIFKTMAGWQEQYFRDGFIELAEKVEISFGLSLIQTFGAFNALSIECTSYALNRNLTWPFVTIPNFDRLASNLLQFSGAVQIGIQQIVFTHDREKWEEYVLQNDGWIQDVIKRENDLLSMMGLKNVSAVADNSQEIGLVGPRGYSENVYRYEKSKGNGEEVRVVDHGDYLFAVIGWQTYPLNLGVINYNFLETERGLVVPPLISYPRSFASPEIVESLSHKLKLKLRDSSATYRGEIHSEFVYPVWRSFDPSENIPAASLSATVFWPFLFENLLPPGSGTIVAVMENECGASFSMAIHGNHVESLGEGDFHNSEYNSIARSFSLVDITHDDKFRKSSTFVPLNPNMCPLTVKLYPTAQLEGQYDTLQPLWWSIICGAYLLILSVVLLMYTKRMKGQYRLIIRNAIESGSYVSSIFPKHVQDRLLAIQKAEKEGSGLVSAPNTLERCYETSISDYYSNCSIFFAKVDGFDEWSAGRDPVEVFSLLETLFGAIDQLAKRFKVFKVETIAATYLAVTSIPEHQPDHAIRMARFASRCLKESERILNEQVLKCMTSDDDDEFFTLRLTVGIHSGGVTAGVMGGHLKSRFQVFGDAVNTSSRMMSTGAPGRVHLSPDMALALIESDHGYLLEKRDDVVIVKGKGEIQTFWLCEVSYAPSVATSSGCLLRDASITSGLSCGSG